jgi:hypothetical protein
VRPHGQRRHKTLSVATARTASTPTMASGRHPHTRGHLDTGNRPRCGCGPEVLDADAYTTTHNGSPGDAWPPQRRQLTGFVRAHFIYSDRMRCGLSQGVDSEHVAD